MKLVLEMSPTKTIVNIDPIHSQVDRRFNPLVSVAVFHVGEEMGDTKPKIINAYSGHLSTLDAGLLAESIFTASFMASRVEAGESLEAVFNTMQATRKEKLKRIIADHGKQYQIH
ncbi:MAG: hypothetical protein ACRBBW_20450 [Cellvibrionaceae bacterium]